MDIEFSKKFSREITENIAKELYAIGYLSDSDLENRDVLFDKIFKALKNHEISFIVDHTDSIIQQAKSFADRGDFDLSILMFATYFEHSLNAIIAHDLQIKDISNKSKNELIRSVNIAGKCGWLLEVLDLPNLNLRHKKTIIDLSSKRNAYVHYKWNPEQEDTGIEQKKKKELIESAIKAVKYMKYYTSKIRFKGSKTALLNLVNNK